MYQKNHIGKSGFVWWYGVVENRNDPLFLGRCQIRIYGYHSDDLTQIPSADLPWAQPVIPPNASKTFSAPQEGEMIVGFFADDESAQMPVYLGVLPGIPSQAANQSKGFNDLRVKEQLDNAPVKPVSRLLTGTDGVLVKTENRTPYPRDIDVPTTSQLAINESTANTVIDFRLKNWVQVDSVNGSTWKEPVTGYNTLYPFNSTFESESGHVIQVDDTPGNERIMFAHRTGTTTEYYNSGTKLDKVVKDNYTIVHGSDFVYVQGKVVLTCDNVAHIRIKGAAVIEIDGDVDWKVGGNMNLTVGKNLNIKTAQDVNFDVGGNIEQVTQGSFHAQAGSTFDVLATGIVSLDGAIVMIDPLDLSGGGSPGATAAGIESPNGYNNPPEVTPTPEKIKPVKYPKPAVPAAILPPTDATKPENAMVSDTPQPAANTTDFLSSSTDICFTLPMMQAATFGTTPVSMLNKYLPGLNKLCTKYGINTPLRKSHFLAQIAHESGGFYTTEENLNYDAAGLIRTWPTLFDATTAPLYAHQPMKIANRAYANRMGNGDEASGDGWLYHGRGLIQLTGHDNYVRFANAIGMSLADAIAYLQTPDGAVESAGWFWASRSINLAADNNDINTVTKLVNGGLNGIQDRINRFDAVYPLTQQ